MNNNLIGITLSALVHVGVLSWASGISNAPVKKLLPLDNIALTVSLFEAEKAITPPASAPSPVEKEIMEETEPLSPITKLSPPIKIASLSPIPKIVPKIEPELKSEPIVAPVIERKPTAKERITTPVPVNSKTIPKVPASKKTKKPKRSIKKKLLTKKTAPKKVIKKTAKRRVIKKSAVIKKRVIQKRKIVAKAQPRLQAIVTPTKRRTIVTKARTTRSNDYPKDKVTNRVKTGEVAKKNKLNKPKKSDVQPREHASSAPATSKQSFLNANLSKRYKARLQQLIATKKRYPKRAKRRGHQGKVTVSFRVIHSGIISEIKIVKASKHKDLNTATLNAIKQVSGKLPYTKGMSKKALTLSVTLSYILR